MIRGQEHPAYEDRLREFNLDRRRLQGDLMAAFLYLKGLEESRRGTFDKGM